MTDAIDIRFDPKDPTGIEDYEINYADLLASLDTGVFITSVTWSITPIADDLSPLALIAHSEDTPITFSRVRLAAGTAGNTYEVRGALTFSDGEGYPISFMLPIGKT